MPVLVVTKTTNWEWYGDFVQEQVRTGRMALDELTRLKTAHTEHYASLEILKEALSRHRIDFRETKRESDFSAFRGVDAVFTVGGDGTLLAASHQMQDDIPVVGIRSSATSVGHLCALTDKTIDPFIKNYVAGNIDVAKRSRLVAKITSAKTGQSILSEPVLNDFLFCNANPAATTRYYITLGTLTESQKSSGVWISTPTGSSAAIKAAGGSVESPEQRRFQFCVRELFLAPGKSYQLRQGFFDPDQLPFEIQNRGENVILALDGQHGEIRIGLGDRIQFLRGKDLQLVVSPDAAR